METIEILKKLKELKSAKQKVELLKQHKANKQLLKLLKAGLDPNRLFQFNKMPCKYNDKEKTKLDFLVSCELFLGLLSKLEDRLMTGNAAKEEVKYIFGKLDKDSYDIFSKILCKKSIGISAKTLNKVWPGAIKEFNLMLAPNELPDLTKLDYPCFIQKKVDGYRAVFKEGNLYTRHGKKFKNENLLRYFDCLNKAGQYVLDGELYMHGKSLQEHTEIFNSHNAPIPSELKFYVFDVIPLEAWEEQAYDRPYKARIKDVRVVCTSLVATLNKVIDVHTEEIWGSDEAVEKYKEYLTKGLEGAIIRSKDGKYQWKRTTVRSGEILKLKPKETVDVQVLEIFEGKGNFEGMAGGFYFKTDKGIKCSVGSGFSLEDRKELFNNKNKYVGKFAEIAIMGRTPTGSYRDPRWMRWRKDKDAK